MKKVLLATPCYNGQVGHLYMQSVIAMMQQAAERGYEITVYTLTDSLITRARNNAVATFLDGQWDYLFWVDADISFQPDQFFRLLDSGHPVVAGVYPLKMQFPPSEPTNLTGQDLQLSMLRYAIRLEGASVAVPDDGFACVHEVATGFMCIARDVMLEMTLVYPELKYASDQGELGAPASENHYLFFDTMVRDGRYLSEDYAFCRRVADMDGAIWVDLRSELTHSGNFDYRGSVLGTSRVNTKA
ncbi:hypothetical protein [Rhizobium arsenicireducens]